MTGMELFTGLPAQWLVAAHTRIQNATRPRSWHADVRRAAKLAQTTNVSSLMAQARDQAHQVGTWLAIDVEYVPTWQCSLFCFAVFDAEAPSDFALAQRQMKMVNGLPRCHEWQLYSGHGSRSRLQQLGLSEQQVRAGAIINGSMAVGNRGMHSSALNWPVFKQVWRAVFADRRSSRCEWTVKTDVDALLLADRLDRLLRLLRSPPRGMLLGNGANHLDPDRHLRLAFGPAEILSRRALSVFRMRFRACETLDPLAAEGRSEDLMLTTCMNVLAVPIFPVPQLLCFLRHAHPKRPNPNLVGRKCASSFHAVFHPLKTPEALSACHRASPSQRSFNLNDSGNSTRRTTQNGKVCFSDPGPASGQSKPRCC